MADDPTQASDKAAVPAAEAAASAPADASRATAARDITPPSDPSASAPTDSTTSDSTASEPASQAPDHGAHWKGLENTTEDDVRAWRKANPNHPVARAMAADESRAARKARDDAKAETERATLAENEARRLKGEADTRAAHEAEIDRLEALSDEGDYDATQRLAELTKNDRRRKRQINDPTLQEQARKDLMVRSALGVADNPFWSDLDQDTLKTSFPEAWTNGETPAHFFGRLHAADLQGKIAKGRLVTAEAHQAVVTELDAFKKEVETIKAAEYARGRESGLGGRPDPEMRPSAGTNGFGPKHVWTRDEIRALDGAGWKQHKQQIEAQASAGLIA